MLRSLYSGISGMKNFQTKLDVIGNNIANVNTYGFKKGRVTFKDTMNQTISGASAAQTDRGGKNPIQVGLGSTISSIDTIQTGASLQTTGRPLDLGVDGDGFFVVKQGEAEFYTRAGNLYLDDNGTLVNADGLKVQAFKYDTTGNITNNLGDVAVNVNATLPSTKTEDINITGNLDGNTITGKDFIQQIEVVLDDGTAKTMDIQYKKNGANWDVAIGGSSFTINSTGTTTPISPTVTLTGLITPVKITINGLTQNPGAGNSAIADANGYTEGKLESFSIGSMGEISGVYSNGEIAKIGRIALAKFSNSSGLSKAANNLFQKTVNSGEPDVKPAGNGRGTIVSGSLEMSNVDLSEEFTDMIVAQRGFQANTKIITTSDEILQELVNLKR
ncbi:MAG TPA: flagellar basal-body rod protein FlgF [Bacillales bacterium]|nr:flagellar basal-body rod protein FlgF [Bacillales bacterium]